MPSENFYDVLTEAVADIAEHGFSNAARVLEWQRRLTSAAQVLIGSADKVEALMRAALESIYRQIVEREGWVKVHPGISRFTVERIKPQLRAELDRFIWSNANLIKLNREEAMGDTNRRFSGWASSVPAGGSSEVSRREVKEHIKKPVTSLSYVERRCVTDQGHKMASAIHETIAKGGNAIAAIWHHHHVTYPRPEHVAREGKVFAIRGNWAIEAGLMKKGENGYTDEIERPGELVSCRCSYTWVYNLRSIPREMLTEKGKAELQRVSVG